LSQIPHIRQFSKYSKLYNEYNFIQKMVAKRLLSSIDLKVRKVLDLGCGDGLVYKNIKFDFDEFIGVDLSPEMLKLHPKDRRVKLSCKDFDNIDNFSEYDLVLSSSALQWSKDTLSLIKKIDKQSRNYALAIFTRGTFESIREFLKIKSFLPKKEKIENILNKNVSCETVTHKIEFEDNLSMLKYIKKSGVSGGKKVLSIKEVKNFLQNYDKNYLEFEIILIKKISI